MVNVSLLSLAAELHASLSTIQWVTSGYLLALALIVPLNGWLVERSSSMLRGVLGSLLMRPARSRVNTI
jgi:MFS family permease